MRGVSTAIAWRLLRHCVASVAPLHGVYCGGINSIISQIPARRQFAGCTNGTRAVYLSWYPLIHRDRDAMHGRLLWGCQFNYRDRDAMHGRLYLKQNPMDKFKNKYRIQSTRLQNWDYGSPGLY